MAELIAGVDLGGTKIQSVVVANARVVGQARLTTPTADADAVTAEVTRSVVLALENAGASIGDLLAVGIGSPGAVRPDTGEVSKSANVAGFMEPVPLGPAVSRQLEGVTVTVENDVRAAAIGELRHGAGRRYDDFLGIFVGSGVGGGLVLGRQLRRGHDNAGEIGHTTVRPGGRLCGCGRLGCVEAYAGRVSIERRARQHVAKGRKTKLFEIMERKRRDRVTSSVIAEALEHGDALTIELIDKAVVALGMAISNTQNLLDIDAFIVGGGLADRLGPAFVGRLEQEMLAGLRVPERPPEVVASELKDLSGALGATVLADEASMRNGSSAHTWREPAGA
jgi:predicted NBD/HSP70 family sugar kinase